MNTDRAMTISKKTTPSATMRKCLVLLSIIFGLSTAILTANAFVLERSTCTTLCDRRHKENRRCLHAQSNPEDKIASKNNENTDDADEDPVEVFLAMEEASKKTTRRLLLPRMIMTSIGQVITYSAYAFLISSFALNIAGYSFLNDGNGIRIGTLEEKAFQMEIAKSMKDK